MTTWQYDIHIRFVLYPETQTDDGDVIPSHTYYRAVVDRWPEGADSSDLGSRERKCIESPWIDEWTVGEFGTPPRRLTDPDKALQDLLDMVGTVTSH